MPPISPELQDSGFKSQVEALLKKVEQQQHQEANSVLDNLGSLLIHEILQQREESHEITHQQSQVESSPQDSRFERLERRIIELRELQQKRHDESEEARKAEKAKSDAIAAQEAKAEQQRLEEQVATARAAKETAEKALRVAEEQAADRARKEAEAQAAADRLKAEEELHKLNERHEMRLAAISKQLEDLKAAKAAPDGNASCLPLRRTCIAEGERRIEISEFTRDRLDPLITSTAAPSSLWHEENFGTSWTDWDSIKRPRIEGAHRRGSRATADGRASFLRPYSSPNAHSRRGMPGKTILLPSHVDRTSTEISGMQDLLDKRGIVTSFDGAHQGESRALVRTGTAGEGVVHSSVFWEPPLMTLGSELLETLRFRSWKPLYARSSGM